MPKGYKTCLKCMNEVSGIPRKICPFCGYIFGTYPAEEKVLSDYLDKIKRKKWAEDNSEKKYNYYKLQREKEKDKLELLKILFGEEYVKKIIKKNKDESKNYYQKNKDRIKDRSKKQYQETKELKLLYPNWDDLTREERKELRKKYRKN